ncbi:glucans biosynthesis glucosyltransferase MdoH [Gilvimarinus sp. DA14]|uniref:glucans biosynthesis glucosyltransferase MdoH n=1 Tax=Gilvimarinus sp. DA14 TaxID=2956798 RepID=UPI0020B64E8A|nr:glucans biosynthesis glucosyltransferase MdoH [Gilvimarinus sp. DA14]UTF61441.1 glucans biosynthesis glucosyltransferase MdoH [Gilvimarinus sp. DA14]
MSGTPMLYSKMSSQEPTGAADSDHSNDRPRENTITMPGKTARRALFFTLVFLLGALGVGMMFEILRPNEITWLEISLLGLFAITFLWIVFAFTSGAIGFALQLFKIDPLTLKRQTSIPSPHPRVNTRTAVIMPVYNEDTGRVIAGFESSLRSLEQTGQLDAFDFYLISDTQDPDIARAEAGAWQRLCERLGPLAEKVYYRRRVNNTGRKVGNVSDFCCRWGDQYESMIVLDADSVMSGECMLSLVHAMEQNPKAALVQTVPIPVRQHTMFGRFLQFAADLYSPMLATGLAFWQTDTANYWGHNAIIRIDPFIQHCGLPELKGRGPFSGEILSHDFVEAAMLRRAGWDVILLADLRGSYEEVPSNMLDYATRDRRWVQGNIQHMGIVRGKGLHGLSRLHFLQGAIAYVSSLLWLSMLALSSIDAVVRATTSNEFFTSGFQLFPNWPIAKTGLIFSLLSLTVALLILPKVFGVIIALIHRRAEFGGAIKLLAGATIETLFAILIAPLMMVFHAYFVVSVLVGHKVSWNAQAREGRMVPWREAFAHTLPATLVALLWGGVSYVLTPVFFWWMTPVLAGLVLAAPIVRYSSSLSLGLWLRDKGIFITPPETREPAVLTEVAKYLDENSGEYPDCPEPAVPASRWREMPIQSF